MAADSNGGDVAGRLSRAIKRRRMELGHKTIKDMAEALSVSPSTLGDWEGGRALPSQSNAALLAQHGVILPDGLTEARARTGSDADAFEDSGDLAEEALSGDSLDEAGSVGTSQEPLRRLAHEVKDTGDTLVLDQEFFLPVVGFARFTSDEVEVINHPALQRLGSVYQLGQTHLVYRGATHSRLEHVLGTVAVLQAMISAVNENQSRLLRNGSDGAPLGRPISPLEMRFSRLAALLHDIGHLPMGHTLEDELGLLPKHDGIRRLEMILDKDQWFGLKVEPLGDVLRRLFSRWLGDGWDPVQVVTGLISKEAAYDSIPDSIRAGVCRDMVGNTICADLLDYLHRDWYHLGKQKYRDERLLQYMEIRKDADDVDRFLISLGAEPKIRSDAVSSILQLLESRYELQESVLYHRAKCSAAAMLERGIQEIHAVKRRGNRDADWLNELESRLIEANDEAAVQGLLEQAKDTGADAAVLPLASLRGRRLYKAFHTHFKERLVGLEATQLMRWFSQGESAPENRRFAAAMLERDAGLPPGSVVIYCPDKSMNVKLAKVRIHFDGAVDLLNQWEETHSDMLTGGHLKAQIERFKKLWRIHVFVEASALEALSDKRESLLHRLIDCAVLGRATQGMTAAQAAQELAHEFAATPGTPFHGAEAAGPAVFTDDKGVAHRGYPSGVAPLAAHFPEL